MLTTLPRLTGQCYFGTIGHKKTPGTLGQGVLFF